MIITITNWSDGTAIYSVEAVDLREAVRRAVKNRVSLAQAELLFTDLSGADLFGTNLRRADLSRANLCGASLSSANLHGAKLRGADLRDAALDGVELGLANLREALGVDHGPEKQKTEE